MGIDDPTVGLYSPTALKRLPTLVNNIRDDLKQIISGKAQLNDLDETVSKFRSQGGDAMRKEFQDAIRKHQG